MTIAKTAIKQIKGQKSGRNARYEANIIAVHNPTTDIIKQIEKVTPEKGLIQNVKVTPEIAADLMTLNKNNRPIRIDTVNKYAKEMNMGLWIFSGDLIKISDKMTLLDSQQRLLAIIKSGKPQLFHIQTGIPPKAFSVMDTGRVRSAGDVLAIEGINHYNLFAAAIKSEIYFREQNRVAGNVFSKRVENHQVVDWIQNKDNLKLMTECIDYVTKFLYKKSAILARSTWAWVYYVLSKKHRGQAKEFLTALATGANLGYTNPIYLLREKLLSFKKSIDPQHKTFLDIKIRYIIAAWNHYRRNQKPRELKIDIKSIEIEKPI